MDNCFTYTFSNITFKNVSTRPGEDENPFIADLFNDKITEVGHIHLVPLQNRMEIAAVLDDEVKMYNIVEPRLEFLKFIFENANPQVKTAIRSYFRNSPDAQKQFAANRV